MPKKQPPTGVHKPTERELDPKRGRVEKKYERLTGRNPRLGIVRSPDPRKK